VQAHRFDLDTHDLSMLQLFKQAIEHAILGPAVHASVDGVPIAEAFTDQLVNQMRMWG
jgi:hypothetical protein